MSVVQSVNVLSYSAAVLWNLNVTPRRASLPIDPCIAELYVHWGVIGDTSDVLSSYEHSLLRPTSSTEESPPNRLGSCAIAHVTSIVSSSANHENIVGVPELITLPTVTASVMDVNGVIIAVFASSKRITSQDAETLRRFTLLIGIQCRGLCIDECRWVMDALSSDVNESDRRRTNAVFNAPLRPASRATEFYSFWCNGRLSEKDLFKSFVRLGTLVIQWMTTVGKGVLTLGRIPLLLE